MKIRFRDIECYVNLFMDTVIDLNDNVTVFMINKKRNDLKKFVAFYNNTNLVAVGYNNSVYDDPLTNYIIKNYFYLASLSNKEVCKAIFKISTSIIQEDNKEYRYADYFQTLDLMKVLALKKGLKQVAVNLKHHRIQDLPIPWNKPVKEDMIDKMMDYNLNDGIITKKLYHHAIEEIRLRKYVTDKYGINVLSEARSGIANKLFEKWYSEDTGLHPKDFKDLRTNRRVVRFEDAILPQIHFETDELKAMLNSVRKEGVVIDPEKGKISFTLPVFRFGGTEYQIGAGGLHSVDKPGYFESCTKYVYRDCDARSFYPSIMIEYGIKPAHILPVFLKRLRILTGDRVESKGLISLAEAAGDTKLAERYKAEAENLKIAINATFGKLGFRHSFLYDPLAMVQVTLNGQLFLMMLIEQLTIHNFHVISANTDGIITKIPRAREAMYYDICKEWEKKTKFALEYTTYKKYIRTTVNDYLTLKEHDGEFNEKKHIKAKGDLDKDLWKDVTKGFDKPIVSLAVYNHFIHGIPIHKTIRTHTEILDFAMSKKNGAEFKNEIYYAKNGEIIKEELQKSVRYIVTKEGGRLLKAKDNTSKSLVNKTKRSNMVAGEKVTMFNDVTPDLTMDKIKHMYYIIQAQNIIDKIVPKQEKLNLF